jgi:hypothetical protein
VAGSRPQRGEAVTLPRWGPLRGRYGVTWRGEVATLPRWAPLRGWYGVTWRGEVATLPRSGSPPD